MNKQIRFSTNEVRATTRTPLGYSVSSCLRGSLPFIRVSDPHFFFFNDTPTPEIYTLSLHDALPISVPERSSRGSGSGYPFAMARRSASEKRRSEEYTSELQSPYELVCRLLLEKKKKKDCCSCVCKNRSYFNIRW